MIEMPDGVKIDMQWKKVKYINGKNNITFEIIPMFSGKDVVIIPNYENWKEIFDIFSEKERGEIVFLLERPNWTRDVRVFEANITPIVNQPDVIIQGSIESTDGYKKLSSENLFDPGSPLSKVQVKEIYCELEKRFAENASGKVTIPKNVILNGSVLEKISIETLKKNPNVSLQLV